MPQQKRHRSAARRPRARTAPPTPAPTTTKPAPLRGLTASDDWDGRPGRTSAEVVSEQEIAELEQEIVELKARLPDSVRRLEQAIRAFLAAHRPGPWLDQAREALGAIERGAAEHAATLFYDAVRCRVADAARRGMRHGEGRGFEDITKVLIAYLTEHPQATTQDVRLYLRDLATKKHNVVLAVGEGVLIGGLAGSPVGVDRLHSVRSLPRRAVAWWDLDHHSEEVLRDDQLVARVKRLRRTLGVSPRRLPPPR